MATGIFTTVDPVHFSRALLENPVREASKQLAAAREDYARRLLEERLPKRMHWLIDRPRLLKLALRLWPRWSPTFTVVPLGITADGPTALYRANQWVGNMRADDISVPDSGLIFTYTDVSGMPAELHGV